jgi:two-component system, sensor histidine kinase PdtaS
MPMRRYLRPLMQVRQMPLGLRWLGAAALVGVAFAVRYAFNDAAVSPYLGFLPAVILSAVIFSRGSSVVATALSALLALFFFVEPVHSLRIDRPIDLVNLGLFLAVGIFIAGVVEALRRAFIEAEDTNRSLAEARARAEAGEHEREMLLAEFRHRVSNDLQRLSSMILLQAKAAPQAAAELRAAATRIQVIAGVHSRLARRDGHVLVDMREFLHDLIADLRASLTNLYPVGLFVDAEAHPLSVSRAGSIGLIANELVTNALKHAFPEGAREGAVTVGFRRDGVDFVLTVADDGVGMAHPPSRPGAGMGSRLVRALAAQLGGHLATESQPGGGTCHTLRFPVAPPAGAEHAQLRH